MAGQTMTAEQRRSQLLEMVRQRGFASLPDLADALSVSESTVRRDLDSLEQSGAAKRTHGGAFYTGPSPKLPHFDLRQQVEWDKKKAIARRAAELVEDGETLLLDGGSTTYELARLLVTRPLQVVTTSLPVANLFMTSVTRGPGLGRRLRPQPHRRGGRAVCRPDARQPERPQGLLERCGGQSTGVF